MTTARAATLCASCLMTVRDTVKYMGTLTVGRQMAMMTTTPIDYVNTYLLLTKRVWSVSGNMGAEMLERRESLVCASGLILSVQGSEFHYCTPRSNTGPYSAVEVMVMEGEVTTAWEEFTNDVDTKYRVYSWMPVKLVNQTIEDNGGIQDAHTNA